MTHPDMTMNINASAVPDAMETERLVENKDKHFATVQLQEEDTFQNHQHNAVWLLHAVELEKNALRNLSETTHAMSQDLRSRADGSFKKLRQDRHAAETRMEHLAQVKVAEGHGLLADEAALQKEARQYSRELGDEVCHLYSDIEKSRGFRVEKGEKLRTAVTHKFDEIRDAIAAENRIRLESEGTLLELFGQMGNKMQKELDATRKDRLATTDRLIKVMEEVVPTLERTRLFKSSAARRNMDASMDPRSLFETSKLAARRA